MNVTGMYIKTNRFYSWLWGWLFIIIDASSWILCGEWGVDFVIFSYQHNIAHQKTVYLYSYYIHEVVQLLIQLSENIV